MGFPGAEIVQRSSDQLFSGAGLSKNDHCGIGGRHRLNLFQDTPKRFAVSDNLFEVKFAADFGLEVDILLRELIFEFGNLSVGKSVFDGQRDLIRNLALESKII